MQVEVARSVVDAVTAHARAARPAECCGLLIGDKVRVVEAVASANLATDPNRFLIDPQTHIDARRSARARGLSLVGFYHSHPHSSAVPSPVDVAEASYADHLCLIVGLGTDPPELGLFVFEQVNFRPIALVTAR